MKTNLQKENISTDEVDRYSRQMMLPELGLQGQLKLKGARVLVIGAGGIGSSSLMYLAAAGIGTIGIVDDDLVDVSNLHRQVIHSEAQAGIPKAWSRSLGLFSLRAHDGHQFQDQGGDPPGAHHQAQR